MVPKTKEELIKVVYDVMQEAPLTSSDIEDAETIVDAILDALDITLAPIVGETKR